MRSLRLITGNRDALINFNESNNEHRATGIYPRFEDVVISNLHLFISNNCKSSKEEQFNMYELAVNGLVVPCTRFK